MEVRAQILINKDEEITTRYLGPWEGQPRRQEKIARNWKFICDCTRCKDPSDIATYFSAIKCQACLNKLGVNDSNQGPTSDILSKTASGENSYLLPNDVQMLGTPWQCNACGFRQNRGEIERILESLDEALVQIKSEALAIDSNDLSKLADYIKLSINRVHTKVHPNHFLLFQFKNWFLQLHLPDHLCLPKIQHRISTGIHTDLSGQISFLELQMEYRSDILKIIEVLDPGLTINLSLIHI